MKKTLIIIIAASILTVAGIFVFFPKKSSHLSQEISGQNKKTDEISVLFPASIETVSFMFDMASDKGYFMREDLKVKKIEANKNSFATFMAGGSDIFMGGINSASAAYLNGGEPRVLADLVRLSNTYALSRYPKDKAKSIKKVSTGSATSETVPTAKLFLQALGADPKSVKYVPISDITAREAALASGEVDMAIIDSYKFLQHSDAYRKYTVFDASLIPGDLPFDKYIVTTEQAIKDKPNAVQKFVKAYYELISYIKANPKDTEQYLKDKYGYTDEEAIRFYDSFFYAEKGLDFIPDNHTVESAAATSKKELGIDSTRDLKDFIYPDFAQKAAGSAR